MRISDWSSDVCSSDLQRERRVAAETAQIDRRAAADIDAIRPRDIEADAGLLTPTEALRDRAYDFAERRLARIADIVLTELGRASCRGGVCPDVEISVVAEAMKEQG